MIRTRTFVITLLIVISFSVFLNTRADVPKEPTYYTTQESIGHFVDGWEFYYKDENGSMHTLKEWHDLEQPIFYQDRLYIRSGFLLRFLGYGGTFDHDNKTITIYHPNYAEEGLDTVPYDSVKTNDPEEKKETTEKPEEIPNKTDENGQHLEGELSKEEKDAIITYVDEINDGLYDITRIIRDTSLTADEVVAKINQRMEGTSKKIEYLKQYENSSTHLKDFLFLFDEAVMFIDPAITTRSEKDLTRLQNSIAANAGALHALGEEWDYLIWGN